MLRDRRRLLGLLPPQDARLRLHRRIQHRSAGCEALHPRLHATPACSTRRSSSASPRRRTRRAPLVIPWSTAPQSTAQPARRDGERHRVRGDGDSGGRRGTALRSVPAGAPGGTRRAGAAGRGRPARGPPLLGRRAAPRPGPGHAGSASTPTRSRASAGRRSRMILALDASPAAVEHGPSGYIGLAGNLLPGWTIAMLALALLFPVVLGAGAGLASSARSPIEAVRGFLWAGLRAVPFLGALLILLAAALVGLLPESGLPLRPPRRGTRPRRNDLGGRGAPRLWRDRVLHAAAAPAAASGGRDGGARRGPAGLRGGARRLGGQSVSGRAGGARPAGLAPRRHPPGRLAGCRGPPRCSVCCLSAPWSPISRAASTPAWAFGMTCC